MPYSAQQLMTAYAAANNGVAPDILAQATLTTMAQNSTSAAGEAAALTFIINSAQDDIEVAVQAYQFFTGKSPTRAGLDYLTNSTVNPNDLNDPYYAQFNLENRYINFAANLGLFGEGAAAFAQTYAQMAFAGFVEAAYEAVIGVSYAQAAGLNATAAKADIISRRGNFEQLARDRGLIDDRSTNAQIDMAVKAGLIGYLMAEGVKADVGRYAGAANAFVVSLITGAATYNDNMLMSYAAAGGGVGLAIPPGARIGGETPGPTPDPPVPPPTPDPPPPALGFTDSVDKLTGTVGDDTFTAVGAMQPGDAADGGDGVDTLVWNRGDGLVPSLTNIERVLLLNIGLEVDFSAAVGLTAVSVRTAPSVPPTVRTPAGATVGLESYSGGAGATFFGGLAQTSMTLMLDSVSAGFVLLEGPALTTLIVNSHSGANHLQGVGSHAEETTVRIVGPSHLTIDVQLGDSVRTVDAASATGGVSLVLGSALGAGITLTGSPAADVFDASGMGFKMTAALGGGDDRLDLGEYWPTAGSTIDGGPGFDTLTAQANIRYLSGDNQINAFKNGAFANFEQLRLKIFGSSTPHNDIAILDMAGLGPGAEIVLETLQAGLELHNLPANPVVTFLTEEVQFGNHGTQFSLKDPSGAADTLTIRIQAPGHPLHFAGFHIPGVEILNISADGVPQNPDPNLAVFDTIFGGHLADTESLNLINVSGTSRIALFVVAKHSLTVDGSGLSGRAILDVAFRNTVDPGVAIQLIGTPRGDNLQPGNGATLGGVAPRQSIFGGGGGDGIDLTAHHVPINTLVYSAASDSRFTAGGFSGYSLQDVIAEFISGQDKIDLRAFGLNATQSVIADKGAAGSTSALDALVGGSTFFQDNGGTTRGVAIAHLDGDTYLFVDANKNGLFDVNADLGVRFFGLSSLVNGDLIT